MSKDSFNDVAMGILCGGKSSRLGKEKYLLPFHGASLLEFMVSKYQNSGIPMFYVLHQGQKKLPLKIPAYYDLINHRSSLIGIYSALKNSEYPYNLFIACDMPFVPLQLLMEMILERKDYDVIVPGTSWGFQPTCALYHKNCLHNMSKA